MEGTMNKYLVCFNFCGWLSSGSGSVIYTSTHPLGEQLFRDIMVEVKQKTKVREIVITNIIKLEN